MTWTPTGDKPFQRETKLTGPSEPQFTKWARRSLKENSTFLTWELPSSSLKRYISRSVPFLLPVPDNRTNSTQLLYIYRSESASGVKTNQPKWQCLFSVFEYAYGIGFAVKMSSLLFKIAQWKKIFNDRFPGKILSLHLFSIALCGQDTQHGLLIKVINYPGNLGGSFYD